MSTKQELQNLHNRLDKCQRKLDAAKSRGDQEMVTKFTDEADKLSKKNSRDEKQTEIRHEQRA